MRPLFGRNRRLGGLIPTDYSNFDNFFSNAKEYFYKEDTKVIEETDNTVIYQSVFLIILLIGAGILTFLIYRKHDEAKKEREYVEKHSGQLPGV